MTQTREGLIARLTAGGPLACRCSLCPLFGCNNQPSQLGRDAQNNIYHGNNVFPIPEEAIAGLRLTNETPDKQHRLSLTRDGLLNGKLQGGYYFDESPRWIETWREGHCVRRKEMPR